LIVFATACGGIKVQADVPDTPGAIASQIIVDQYIKAYVSYDAEGLIALFHDDYVFMDYGLDDGPLGKGNISYAIKEAMAEPDTWKAQFVSYTITPDGRFAVLEGSFSMGAKIYGDMASAPAYVVLEFQGDQVLSETWYYNGEVFH
jgi:hypothetical protein